MMQTRNRRLQGGKPRIPEDRPSSKESPTARRYRRPPALLLRVERTPDQVSAVDSLRYRRYLNLNLNLQESVYTNALAGTLDREMAAGWLDGMATVICRPWMRAHWEERKSGYHAAFRVAMDSVAAEVRC